MRKHVKAYLFSLFTLALLVTSVIGVNFVFAKGQQQRVDTPVLSGAGVATPATASAVVRQSVNMQNVPQATASAAVGHRQVPFLTGVSAATYAQRKATAAHTTAAPKDPHPFASSDGVSPNTPVLSKSFQGMADSASICPPAGCQPPDMAVAASPTWVVQGVNTSFAVYNTAGALQAGWPKSAQSFFGVPNPGTCDPNGPFLNDPRAFYDTVDGRFWVAMLQVEGAFGINNCPFLTRYWIAVSKTNNPTGVWNVYSFDMSAGTLNATDYTQFGFDKQAVYFSGNMFNQAGNAFQYAEVFGASKASMEAGSAVTAKGFTQLRSAGVFVDTVQPVELQADGKAAPSVEFLVSSYNITSGGGSCSTGCSGIVVWAIRNVLTTPTISRITATSTTYTLAPLADQPGATQTIETSDTRISGTPVYSAGVISFALETAVNNGTAVVPGIFWGQVKPTLNGSGTVTAATITQSGYLSFTGDRAASFGAVMPDANGNLFMVFDSMSNTIFPGAYYTVRRATDPPGTLEVSKSLKKGLVSTTNGRWGDFEATSFDGASTNNVWIAAQYSGPLGDWSSYIGEAHF